MTRHRIEPPPPSPRLYLAVAVPSDAAGAERLAAAIAATGSAADVAAVLLDPGRAGTARRDVLAPLVSAAQRIGAACLIRDEVALAETLGADGAHLSGIAALRSALPALRPNGIAGAGGLTSRHDAMTAAELGADYVMFGEPDAQGGAPSFAQTEERVAWWAEVFETPCVGYARTLAEIEALVAAGADFVAVGEMLLESPGEVAGRLQSRERA